MSSLGPVPAVPPTKAAAEPAEPPRRLDPIAGILSYLIPGLGQVSQGRYAKGILFFFSLHALFFYGMWLASWQNVYLKPVGGNRDEPMRQLLSDVYARPHFLGQFWIGMAAWPAVYQYYHYDPRADPPPDGAAPPVAAPLWGFERAPSDRLRNDLERELGRGIWDLAWVYTVIAGVLNLLVIYDAIAGPAYREVPDEDDEKKEKEPAAA
jgi:Family of unknown function (DUF6677)